MRTLILTAVLGVSSFGLSSAVTAVDITLPPYTTTMNADLADGVSYEIDDSANVGNDYCFVVRFSNGNRVPVKVRGTYTTADGRTHPLNTQLRAGASNQKRCAEVVRIVSVEISSVTQAAF